MGHRVSESDVRKGKSKSRPFSVPWCMVGEKGELEGGKPRMLAISPFHSLSPRLKRKGATAHKPIGQATCM